ncbi:MAG: pilus assembly protein TadG-related protein [Victivallaceae bacterium]
MINKKHIQGGQVMILAVIMIIILLMAIMFMFDLHSIIRAKIKMETAEQSAALTAA